jgi:hypothetical protein
MADAAQQRIDHGRVAEEVAPFVITQICGDDRGVAVITLLHQFEEDVGLFGLQRQVSKLVDQKNIKPAQAIEQLTRRAVGKRGIHLIEQVLGADELASISILQGFEQQARRDSCLAHAGRADQHQVLRLDDEVQLGQSVDLLAVDTRLSCEREAGQRPVLGQIGALDSPCQRGFLSMLPLRSKQAGEELGVGDISLSAALDCSP